MFGLSLANKKSSSVMFDFSPGRPVKGDCFCINYKYLRQAEKTISHESVVP